MSAGTFVRAQGHIQGQITESESTQPASYAEIQIFQSGDTTVYQYSSTDENGHYKLELKNGQYDMRIIFDDYEPMDVTNLMINTNTDTTINIILTTKLEFNNFNEVVILSEQSKNNIQSLYQIQKMNLSMSDGISMDIIAKSTDRHTGEVLKRISGTSIQDNKYVIVRGMNDRYNLSIVDGAVLPGTEPNRKTFSFDIIPSSVIDNITITKSASAELPAEFAGGIIMVNTKEMPSKGFTEFNIGMSFNSNSAFKDFYSGKIYSTDYLGIEGGHRSLPHHFPSFERIQKQYPVIGQQESQFLLNQLNNDYNIYHKKALPSINFQYAHGQVFTLKNSQKLGYQLGINYSHEENIKPNILRQYDNYDYTDVIYNFKTNIGALLNLTYISEHSKISLKTLYNNNFDNQHLQREGVNYSNSSQQMYTAFDLFQKSLLKTALQGEHQFLNNKKINWLLAYNNISNQRPDQKKMTYSKQNDVDGPYYAELSTLGKSNSRLFGTLRENAFQAQVNTTIPIHFLDTTQLKIGIDEQYRYREFSNRYLGAVINTAHPDALEVLVQPISSIFNENNINNDLFRFSEQTIDGDFYTAHSLTTSAFIMLNHQIKRFKINYGIRAENYNTILNSYNKNALNENWLSILPSANIIYSINDLNQLRASYSNTVARPEFREMTNLAYYDYELNAIFNGNPTLQLTDIKNMDLKYEYFMGRGEILSISAFYKHFTNTIEYSVYASNTAYEVTPRNYSKGYNLGLELELRKKLDILSARNFFQQTTFYLNAAYTHSSVLLPDNYYIMGQIQTHRPLAGQSPWNLNAGLYYQDSKDRYSFNLLYNFLGKNLYMIGNDRLSNVYLNDRHILDAQAAFSITDKLKLKINIKDILNSPLTYFMDQNVNGTFERNTFINGQIKVNEDWIWQEYRPGTSYGISIQYKL